MTATARADAKTGGWHLWVAGVAAPIACFVVDYIAGEYVLRFAPAALLALATLGSASLLLSRNHPPAALAAVGPMWVVGGATLALATVLAGPSGASVVLSFPVAWRSTEAVVFMGWALLGLAPIWTGMVYLREASALTREQVAAHGAVRTRLFGLAGGAATILIVVAAQAIDNQFIARQLAALDNRTPGTWRTALQSLKAYPLCGRYRCRQLVCRRLSQGFPVTRAPAPLASAFKQAYGTTVDDACGR